MSRPFLKNFGSGSYAYAYHYAYPYSDPYSVLYPYRYSSSLSSYSKNQNTINVKITLGSRKIKYLQ